MESARESARVGNEAAARSGPLRATGAKMAGDPLRRLEEPVAKLMLSFLHGGDVARCEQVCVRWRRVCSARDVWSGALEREFAGHGGIPGLGAKEAFKRRVAERREEEARQAAERARLEAEEAARLARPRFRPLKLCLAASVHQVANVCYVVPFLLLSVLLPLKLDGYIDAPWDEVLSPMLALGAVVVLQCAAVLTRLLVWDYLFEDVSDGNIVRGLGEEIFDHSALKFAAFAAAAAAWVVWLALLAAKLEDSSFDMSWQGVTGFFVAVMALGVHPAMFAIGRSVLADMGDPRERAVFIGAWLGAHCAALGLVVTAMLAARNADEALAGDAPSLSWPEAFAPLFAGTGAMFIGPWLASLRRPRDCVQLLPLQGAALFLLSVWCAVSVVFEALLVAKLDGDLALSYTRIFICFFVTSGLIVCGSCGGCVIALLSMANDD